MVEELPRLQGLLLHLLQDILPNLIHEPESEENDGAAHPSFIVEINIILSFESDCSVWAPLFPVVGKAEFLK